MPAHFLDSMSTSLGQRRSQARSAVLRIASRTASASASVTTGKVAGVKRRRKIMETYNPKPGSECHDRPWRPCPAVCSSAPTTVPDGAPDSANWLAALIVEPIVVCHSIRRSGSCDRSHGRSKPIERVAIFLDLSEVFGALAPQRFDDLRRRVAHEFFVCKLASDIEDQLLQLVVFFQKPLPERIGIRLGKLQRKVEVLCGVNRASRQVESRPG